MVGLISKKKWALSTLASAVVVAVVAFPVFRAYLYHRSLSPMDLSDYPNTSSSVNVYLDSWRSHDWEKALRVKFLSPPSWEYPEWHEYYENELGHLTPISWDLLGVDITTDKFGEMVAFDVMIQFEEFDSYVQVPLRWIDDYDCWAIMYVDWEFTPFNYGLYRQLFYKESLGRVIVICVLSGCSVLVIGFAWYIVANRKTLSNSRKLAIEAIKQSGFKSTVKKIYGRYTFAFDEARKEWLVLSDAGLMGRIFNFSEIVDCEIYDLTGASAHGVVLKITTTDLSCVSISIPFDNPVVANGVESLFKSVSHGESRASDVEP